MTYFFDDDNPMGGDDTPADPMAAPAEGEEETAPEPPAADPVAAPAEGGDEGGADEETPAV